MTVDWSVYVNKKVLRDGTDWGEAEKIIEDKTRSGKVKRRFAYSCEKRKFSVAFKFTMIEYNAFRDWFENDLHCGMNSFSFPKIDSLDKSIMKVYKICKGGFPKYSNQSGKIMKCSMTWEEQ